MRSAEFDHFAASYEEELAKSLAATGEDRGFYARGRIARTAKCASGMGAEIRRIVDFGCGDGMNAPLLAATFSGSQVRGVDISGASIDRARRLYSSGQVSFMHTDEWKPDGTTDLVFVNGVFHHIEPAEHMPCLGAIRRALRPGGLLAFWENNPWNPGTRYVMSRCSFDREAIPINPRRAHEMLTQAGFSIVRSESHFYFPRPLRLLRPCERWLRGLPLGGQYQVVCRG
jgi:trans-aconitate methyltransferase